MNTQAADYQAQQYDFWNGDMGSIWVRNQQFIDTMLAPVGHKLVNAVCEHSPKKILDIGCGNGSTTRSIYRELTFNIAEKSAPMPACTGIDLSEPMIKNAQRKVEHGQGVEFVSGDAGQYDYGNHQFDMICSRFGVMFFAEPIRAFKHIAHFTAPNGQLRLIVWRTPEPDHFMTAGRSAASKYFDEIEGNPSLGPFSWGDQSVVSEILLQSGWVDLRFEAYDLPCQFPEPELKLFIDKLAPIGYDLDSLDAEQRLSADADIRHAYKQFVKEESVLFDAPVWLISARVTKNLGQ